MIGANIAPIPEGSWSADGLKNIEEITKVLGAAFRSAKPHPITADKVMIALPESVVFSGTFAVPSLNKKELTQSLPFEIADKLSINLEEYSIDYEISNSACKPISGIEHKTTANDKSETKDDDHQPMPTTGPQAAVFAVAAKKSLIESVIELGEMAKVEIAGIDIKSGAIVRAVSPNDQKTRLVVELGASTAVVVVSEGRTLHLTSSVPIGVRAAKDATLMTLDAFKELAGPIFDELGHVIKFYQNRVCPGGKIEEIILTGGGSNIADIDQLFKTETGLPTVIGNPLFLVDAGSYPLKKELARQFTDSIGLAMRGINA